MRFLRSTGGVGVSTGTLVEGFFASFSGFTDFAGKSF
jgi:hypothetical protein